MRSFGYLLQATGLVVTLGALVFCGFQPSMGRMMYTALAGVVVFYTGVALARRSS